MVVLQRLSCLIMVKITKTIYKMDQPKKHRRNSRTEKQFVSIHRKKLYLGYGWEASAKPSV